MSSFSLAFPVIRLIHEHHKRPAENRLLRFAQQHLLDRILGTSLSALALLDVAYHLSAFVIKFIRAPIKAIFQREKLSFHEAWIHLKIAALFRSTVLFGSLYYFVSPSSVSTLFENSLSRMVRALLLSGNPEVFIEPSKAGRMNTGGIGGISNHLPTFMALVDKLAPKIKESMVNTISLMNESKEFGCAPLDRKVKASTLNIDLSESFKKFELPADASFKDKFIVGMAERIFSVILGLISIPLVVSELIRFPIEVIFLCFEALEALVSNQESDLKTSLWLFKLNLIGLVRLLLAIPLCATLGLYDPKKIQFLFSPLYEGDEKEVIDSYKKLLRKIVQLPVEESVLIPLWSYTNNHNEIQESAHAFGFLITKQNENYRLSIINRGFGAEYHPKRGENSKDVDFSWDNIDLEFLNSYLKLHILTNNPKVQKIRGEGVKLLKGNHLTSFVYVLLELIAQEQGAKQFESHHHKRLQRIGNCGISNLLGAMSFHSSMQGNDMQDKRKYKKFVYALKRNVFKDHGYLLDFDLAIKKDVQPAAVVKQTLSKAKEKIKKARSPSDLVGLHHFFGH